jgi:signal transduction histidine kinase
VGVIGSLWRVLATLRWASLAWAAALILQNRDNYARPLGGLVVLGAMLAWTVAATVAYRTGLHRTVVLATDLAMCAGLLYATRFVETADRIASGAPTLTVSWSAVAVAAWAVCYGRRGGLFAAVVVGTANLLVHGRLTQNTFSSFVLLLLLGGVGGYLVRLAVDSEARLSRAVELQAATQERERLARRIHDGVLQALTLIHRRGLELGGEATVLADLAARQERELRKLIARQGEPGPAGTTDVREVVSRLADEAAVLVDVAAPATPVLLPTAVADELCAAVAQALDNVARHAGAAARAWVFVDDEGDAVSVSVRDDGTGLASGALEAAERDGRLGVAQSMRGRIRDLGGTMMIESAPGRGVEVEFRVPRPAAG